MYGDSVDIKERQYELFTQVPNQLGNHSDNDYYYYYFMQAHELEGQ